MKHNQHTMENHKNRQLIKKITNLDNLKRIFEAHDGFCAFYFSFGRYWRPNKMVFHSITMKCLFSMFCCALRFFLSRFFVLFFFSALILPSHAVHSLPLSTSLSFAIPNVYIYRHFMSEKAMKLSVRWFLPFHYVSKCSTSELVVQIPPNMHNL